MKRKQRNLLRIVLSFVLMFAAVTAGLRYTGTVTAQASRGTRSHSFSDWTNFLFDADMEEEQADNREEDVQEDAQEAADEIEVEEDGTYTSKEEVAAYLDKYQHLPDNFITKKEAKALGWVSSEGNLGKVAPGKSIGGDYFGNYEGRVPEKKGREYHECDIDSTGGYRGAKRIIYSNDGLIYYTEDHYETFELLYGEED